MPSSHRRFFLVLALTVPAFALILASGLQAQFPQPPIGPGPGFGPKLGQPGFPPIPNPPIINPPNLPGMINPPFNQPNLGGPKFPTIEKVWVCNRCNAEIGRGAFPPGTCPNCGVKIINGIGGAPGNLNPGMPGGLNPGMPGGLNPPPFNPPAFNPPVFEPPQIEFPAPVAQPNFPEVQNQPPAFFVPQAQVNESGNATMIIVVALLGAALIIAIITLVALKASGAF